MNKKRNVLLLAAALLCCLPLFSDSLLLGDDIHFHLTRIEGICQGLLAGEFPVRINSLQNAGYGNLSATMYPQLFLYPAALLRLAGMSLIGSYKCLLILLNLATVIACYQSVHGITKSEEMSAVAMVLYTFSGYRLTNLYQRAALGEVLAMVFLPVILWGVYEVLWGERRRWKLLALGVSGVIQSHVLTLEMVLVFGILEFLVWLFSPAVKEKGKRLAAGLLAAGLTVFFNASFLVPFLYFCTQDLQCFSIPNELSYHVLYPAQMFSAFQVAEGGSVPPGIMQGEMPLSVGLILLLGSICFAVTAARRESGDTALQAGRHCLVYGILALVLSSYLFPWEKLTAASGFAGATASLQFPWRFLGPASMLLAFVSAVGIVKLSGRIPSGAVYGFFGILLLAGTGFYFDSMAHLLNQTKDEAWVESMVVSDSNYMYREGDTFLPLHLEYRAEDADIRARDESGVLITQVERKGTKMHCLVQSPKENTLYFPLYYFPGYQVTCNRQRIPCYAQDTLVACEIPAGESELEVSYAGLWFFRAGDLASLAALCMTVLWVLDGKRKERAGLERSGT